MPSAPLSGQVPVEQPPVQALAGLTGRLPANAFLRNRYIILRKIGQGGMAAVYQVADTQQPGPQWAIKEMSDAALANQDRAYAVQAFLQEANLLRTLSHPNLPKVIDVFAEGGKYYLVMEFVPGETLQAMLEKRGSNQPFTEAEVLPWAVQLCDVLSYLHSQNPPIVFRDLKPANIMITPQGQVKLIDFGIVRFFKPEKAKDTVALGTPGYAAPEALAGQTDARSDIYSLCVMLHQLLTQNEPLKNMFNIPPARRLNPAVSEGMEGLLVRGVQNQREMRWQSARAMRVELIGLMGSAAGQPVSAARRAVTASDMVAPGWGRSVAASARPASDVFPQEMWEESGTAASGDLSAPGGYHPTAMVTPRSTSRPTTRLIVAARQLSGRQLAFLVVGVAAALVLGTVFLAPALAQISIDWNNVPIFALFGALGYSAYPKRGAAFVSHALLSTVLVATLWLRIGSQGYSWAALALGVLISGAFMEVWVSFLPKIKGPGSGEGSGDTWMREVAWIAGMAFIGTTLFMGLTTNWATGLSIGQWLVSAVLGGMGWFLGDLLQQYLLQRS